MDNSSGVTWLDKRRILFSQKNSAGGMHMGVVTSLEDRSELRTVYFPQDERGMVHLSYPSPDRKWVLVLEMNPIWQPCRVVPMDGSSPGRQIGPKGSCTAAAWSPDGKWTYFAVNGYLWRQQFPDGQPEQMTSGPTRVNGVAVAPDGRSLITSIGMGPSAVWIHDRRGDRPLSSQGYVSHPVFSRDRKSLFYLRSESSGAPPELWRVDVTSEKSERALPGIVMGEFDLSDDSEEVLYSVEPPGKHPQLWVAALDRRSAPRLISDSGGDSPYFDAGGRIIYRRFDGTRYYLAHVNRDGSGHTDVNPEPIGNILSISPDRRWIITIGANPDTGSGTLAVPISGGAPRRICSGCPVTWSLDGRTFYLGVRGPLFADPGKTRVVPMRAGEMLPNLPPSGMQELDEPELFPGSHLIDAFSISPGPDASVYAYVKRTMQWNLFRVSLR